MAAKKSNLGGNSEFDVDRVRRALGNALKGKCPFVGIPLADSSPFIIKRELLINALKGIHVIDAAIQLPFPGHHGGMAYLQIFGVNEFGREYTCKFYAQDRNRALTLNWNWAESQRKSRSGKVGNGTDIPVTSKAERSRRKYQAHIAKLEKKLAKVKLIPRPHHRILEMGKDHSDSGWYQSRGEEWLRYQREKPRRKLAMKLARELTQSAREHRKEHGYYPVDSGHGTLKELYKIARANGFEVRTISQLNTHEKESLMRESSGMVFPYLRRFWEFCGLYKRSEWSWEFKQREIRENDFGAKHYAEWIQTLHARKEILSEIESCRELIRGLDELDERDKPADEIAADIVIGDPEMLQDAIENTLAMEGECNA